MSLIEWHKTPYAPYYQRRCMFKLQQKLKHSTILALNSTMFQNHVTALAHSDTNNGIGLNTRKKNNNFAIVRNSMENYIQRLSFVIRNNQQRNSDGKTVASRQFFSIFFCSLVFPFYFVAVRSPLFRDGENSKIVLVF